LSDAKPASSVSAGCLRRRPSLMQYRPLRYYVGARHSSGAHARSNQVPRTCLYTSRSTQLCSTPPAQSFASLGNESTEYFFYRLRRDKIRFNSYSYNLLRSRISSYRSPTILSLSFCGTMPSSNCTFRFCFSFFSTLIMLSHLVEDIKYGSCAV